MSLICTNDNIVYRKIFLTNLDGASLHHCISYNANWHLTHRPISLNRKPAAELDRHLNENKSEIEKLRGLLKDVLRSEHDDVWLLRYILSNKNAVESEEPCRFTIKWRDDNKDLLSKIAAGEAHPLKDVISQYQVAGPHKMTASGEPMFYVRIG